MSDTEREFKWDASARGAFVCFVQALEKTADRILSTEDIAITDYYLDNERGDFSARKVALRIRHNGTGWQATLKSRNRLQNGLAVRQEFNLSLSTARSFGGALRLLQKHKTWKELSLQGLRERFRICNRRRIYTCCYGKCVCEAALDNYVTVACGHQMRRKEIELELKKGNLKNFTKLIKMLSTASSLKAAKISKVAGAEKWISQKFSLN